jgi:DNA-binding response OmpR family regulator
MSVTAAMSLERAISSTEIFTGAGNGQRHVLLIEDDVDAMSLVKYALTRFGNGHYCLIWAKTLCEGLQRVSAGNIDLVLLDLGLPESTGPLSYAWFRNQAIDVPIVVLTADNTEETKDAVIAGGASNYLLKQNISGPLLVLAIETALRSVASGRADRLTQVEVQPYRLLLIEDDEDAMLLVGYALEEYGAGKFSMEWKRSLTSGLERIAAGNIDIVLLDLGLPDSTGTMAYLALRKAAPAIPIVVLTGNRETDVEFVLLAYGADEYLDKCLTSGSRLIQSMQGVLNEQKGERGGRWV